jgi:hypothetical protein
MMTDDKTLICKTVIGGKRHPDGFVLVTLGPFAPMGRLNVDAFFI